MSHAKIAPKHHLLPLSAKDQLELTRPGAKPADQMSASAAGLKLIWTMESMVNVSCGVTVPDSRSGVTIGAGYDLSKRTSGEVTDDLDDILSQSQASALSAAAGLVGTRMPWALVAKRIAENRPFIDLKVPTFGPGGYNVQTSYFSTQPPKPVTLGPVAAAIKPPAARLASYSCALDFCFQNDRTFCLSVDQQMTLLKKIVEDKYAEIVYRIFKNIPLLQNEFDALISISFNASRSMGNMPALIIEGIKAKSFDALQKDILARSTSDEHSKAGILKRRNAEAGLFISADYEPSSFKDERTSMQNWQCGTPGLHSHQGLRKTDYRHYQSLVTGTPLPKKHH